MKYIFLPIIKFVISLIWTVVNIFLYLLIIIFTLIWEFRLMYKAEDFEETYEGRLLEKTFSLYFKKIKRNEPTFDKPYKSVKFKSFIHLIWNIDGEIIEE